MVDPLSFWLIVIASIGVGALGGVLFERTRGTAAKRAAQFEADLVRARSDLMHYQDQTKHHFGKSAELLGQMAKDYREFVDHFITGAQVLCGSNLKELNESGLDRPLLDAATVAPPPPAPITPTPTRTLGTVASVPPIAEIPSVAVPPMATVAATTVPPMAPIAANATVPPLDSDPFVEAK